MGCQGCTLRYAHDILGPKVAQVALEFDRAKTPENFCPWWLPIESARLSRLNPFDVPRGETEAA